MLFDLKSKKCKFIQLSPVMCAVSFCSESQALVCCCRKGCWHSPASLRGGSSLDQGKVNKSLLT